MKEDNEEIPGLKYILKGIDTKHGKEMHERGVRLKYILKGIDTNVSFTGTSQSFTV